MQLRRKFKDILYPSPRLGSELRTFLKVSANSFSVAAITGSDGDGGYGDIRTMNGANSLDISSTTSIPQGTELV